LANARVTYTGDGSATSYTVSFPFINRTHVVVTVNGVTQTLTTHYVWLNDSTIQFVTAPPSSQAVVFRRYTPVASRLVDFHDAAVLTEADLDLDSVQHLYLAQERADEQEALTASTVQSVTGTTPIVSSGGATPAVSITAATTSAAGSMSAADKVKIDATSGTNTGDNAGVTAVTGTTPVVSSGGTTPAISMAAATASVDGYATSTQITKLDGIATAATANGTVTGSGTTSGTNTGDQTNITGNAGTATLATNVSTNANLTGHVTSVGNATTLGSFTSDQLRTALATDTGTGSVVFDTNPAIAAPTINGGTINGGTIDGTVIGSASAAAITATDVTATGTVTVPTPSSNTDAATKAYVDTIKQGSIDIKDSVRVASTANIAIASALTNGSTIDGVTVATGNRVLLKNQTDASENGIYAVVASGAASRTLDANTNTLVTNGMYTFVSEGTASNATGYVLTTLDPITLDTDGSGTPPTNLTFTQFSGAGQIDAGAGLTKTGNTLDVVGTSGRIVANANTVDIGSDVALVANPLSQFGATTSAQLKGVLSDETGSGAAVFGTSPTLISPALGTPASGVVTNLTGTASININGTVGASTPSAATTTTLNTSGTVVHNDAGAAVDFRVEGDTQPFLLFASGTEDKVGVKTSGPVEALQVSGAIKVTGAIETDTANSGCMGYQNSKYRFISWGGDNSTKGAYSFEGYSANGSVNGTHLGILADGKVGINKAAPVTQLHIEGGGTSLPATTGTTPSVGTTVRIRSGDNAILDIGGNSTSGAWLQSYDQTGMQTEYPLLLNPNGGNVGIGTTAPAHKMEIRSDLAVYDGSGNLGFRANGTTATQIWQTLQSPNDLTLKTTADKYMAFQTNSSEKMRIASDGKVGIGTTGPQAKLDVRDDIDESSAYTGQLALNSVTKSAGHLARIILSHDDHGSASIASDYESAGYGNLIFSTRGGGNPTERMRIAGNGNVGIGTSAPESDSILELESGSPGPRLRLTNTTTNGKSYKIFSNNAGELAVLGNGNDTRISLNDSGVVSVGGTTATAKFNVIGQGGSDVQLVNTIASGTGTFVHVGFKNDNGLIGSIQAGGTSTSYVTSSDYRIKENVKYEWSATERLKKLKPARFNFIVDPDTTVDGFIAHEAQEVVPESVTGFKDEVDDDDNPVMQGIDQAKLVPLLVKTVQEQQTVIESLEARIAKLEENK